jgi:hypothetical protein
VHTPFDPPPGWDGGCTPWEAAAAGATCGKEPCVVSLTIAPLELSEGGCATSRPGAPESPATWQTRAHTCQGWLQGTCGDDGHVCVPAAPPGQGFRTCISHDGDTACPPGTPYQDRRVFFAGFVDTRSCGACTCGPPAGSACTAEISIYQDAACASTPGYVETIDALGPACHDLVAGTALGSKAASVPVYTPGACAPSGGEPTGSAKPVDPSTYCCIFEP